jgi:hypothetical protein
MARWYAFVVVPMSLAALIGSACDVPMQSTAGSGTVKTETRQVSGFSSVDFNGSGTLDIRQTGTESLTIESDDNVLPTLESDVAGDVLRLGPRSLRSPRTTRLVYTLTVRSLNHITLQGDATVSARDIQTTALGVNVQGSGHVDVAGHTQSEDVSILGSGRIDTSGLTARTARVDITGAGVGIVNVSDHIDASINPSSKLEYSGSPSVSTSGGGSVIRHG